MPVYLNDFNDPIYTYKLVPPPPANNVQKTLTALDPAYSQLIPILNAPSVKFGALLPGVTDSNPVPPTTITVEQSGARLCTAPSGTQSMKTQNGTAVIVNGAAASAAQDQSLGFFLVPGTFGISAIDFSVTFDTPTASTADKWAVALALKSGDQSDHSISHQGEAVDQLIGVTCQFKTGGVYIAALTPVNQPVPAGVVTTEADSGKTFAQYDSTCTEFVLRYAIAPNAHGTLTATASIIAGNSVPVVPGVASFPINLPNLNWVTAIGTSVTTKSAIPQFGVTFRSLTINSVTLIPG